MAKVVIGAEIKVDGLDAAGQSVGSFKKQLREAQGELVAMADKFGLASSQAQAAAMKVAGLKDSIGDAKALADTFNPDKKFVALGGAVQGVVAGFSAYSGAMGLLGLESKETEKLLLRVQSAMAIQQGLSGIAGAVDSFKLLGTTIVQKVVTAFSTLRGAIISTGIGALVVGLGILIANFDKVKSALGFATVAQKAYNDTIKDFEGGAKTAIEKTNQVRAAFDNAKAGVLSKKEALDIYNTTLGDTLGKAKNLEQAEDLYNKKAGVYIQIMGLKAQANALFAKSADEAAKGIVAANEDNVSLFDKITASVKLNLGSVAGFSSTIAEGQKKGTALAQENAKKNSEALYQEGLKLGTQAEKLERDNAITITDIKEKAVAKVKKIDDKAAKDKLEAAKKAEEIRVQQLKNTDALIEENRLLAIKNEFTKSQLELEDKHQKEIDAQIVFLNAKEINKEEYEKRALLINDKYKILQAGLLTEKEAKDKETTKATREKELTDLKAHNDAKLAEVLRVNAASGEDSPEAAMLKIQNIAAAKIEAENAAYEIEKEQKAGQLGELALLAENHKNKLISIDKDAAAEKKAIAEAELAHKKAMQQADLDLIGQGIGFLKSLAGKNKALQKAAIIAENALGIAKIITNTNAANSAAILKYSLIPGGQALSAAEIVRNKIGAAIGIASTIAATAKALSAIGGGGGAASGGSVGGGGGGVGSAVTAPLSPEAQVTNLSQSSINAVGNAANRAYVLETDVSNNQERIRRLNRASRIN
jgi:hypothetical protein